MILSCVGDCERAFTIEESSTNKECFACHQLISTTENIGCYSCNNYFCCVGSNKLCQRCEHGYCLQCILTKKDVCECHGLPALLKDGNVLWECYRCFERKSCVQCQECAKLYCNQAVPYVLCTLRENICFDCHEVTYYQYLACNILLLLT
jgi:hypothetical protein